MNKIVLLFLLFPLLSFTQNELTLLFSVAEDYFDQEDLEWHYLLADSVNLRSCAGTNCSAVGLLTIGSSFVILEQSEDMLVLKGIKSHWYKIRTAQETGWIWGGFIAKWAFGSQSNSNTKFVAGLESVDYSEGYPQKTYQIRAFQAHKQIDKLSLEHDHALSGIYSLGNATLSQLDDIIQIDVPCEGGCGCTTGEIIIFWNGTQFSEPVSLLGSADAWASDYSYFTYPSDMRGIPNTIVKTTNEFIEEVNEYEVERKLSTHFYIWNGHQLVADPKRSPTSKTYLMKM